MYVYMGSIKGKYKYNIYKYVKLKVKLKNR